jgi:superfamily II RNA helicase
VLLPRVEVLILLCSLFRIGFCRVVVSTEELALGVNMPAKAAVFCGDSTALNALNYRQCAGRAGRRGFDLVSWLR